MKNIFDTMKNVLAAILMIAVLIGAGFAGGYFYSTHKNATTEIAVEESSDTGIDLKMPGEEERLVITIGDIESKLVNISELSTVECVVDVDDYGNEYNRNIPGTKNSISVDCNCIIKVGYDCDNIQISVDEDAQKIFISIPDPEVLDQYIVWESVECTEKNNILNPIHFSEYQELFSGIEEEGIQKAEAQGIYEKADNNIQTLICSLLSGFEDYEVVFS